MMGEETMIDLEISEGTQIGIDIGSTTAKIVVVKDGQTVFDSYERHFSQVRSKTLELIRRVKDHIVGDKIKVAISGSAGLGLARATGIPFVQEVFATGETVKRLAPDTSVVVELGGEDAKVIFFKGGIDERMNGTCAGGTGAFIDQMATLLDVSVNELDEMSERATRIYPIASRCGVFAKTDIQPLLNQGAAKENIAASIFAAVTNQTIAGLAQGRRIEGKVMFLGGPLYYCHGLRRAFVNALELKEDEAIFPEYARLSVALGAAIYASKQSKTFEYSELESIIEASLEEKTETAHGDPLFENEQEYCAFKERHSRASVKCVSPSEYDGGNTYLGIDCGSTTTKLTLIGEGGEILYSFYDSNHGNPVEIVRGQLIEIYSLFGDKLRIASSAVTGYGEELIKNAFHIDRGLVETMAHFTAAHHFDPNVDFILDIGGQDIKCFKVKNNAIDSIMLNEACSSGCGSFIETFAKSMGYSIDKFAELGLFARAPVDLGSRCTVFMNSSVKQAQKDGASVGDISAGLSTSVVKNAIYKVIRVTNADELGHHVVVQGGTFYNDAVLRAFEREIGREVIRPSIAGLMGAYGAALYAKSSGETRSRMLDRHALECFTHTSRAATCNGCTNNCKLTVNIFNENERYISGNQCDRGAGLRERADEIDVVPNLHRFKREKFSELMKDTGEGSLGTVGLPLALGMYELGVFWHSFFKTLGYRVEFSGFSSRGLYSKGQYSIPSDTACYPAKIMHGHIEKLIERGVDIIFYPCLTYNVDESISDNHYNCPVVAYYSELLSGNMESLRNVEFLYPYVNINSEKEFVRGMWNALKGREGIRKKDVVRAANEAYRAYDEWMRSIRVEGDRAIAWAREREKRIMILAGRPYHIDPEIGHGIDRLAANLGFVVVTEDSLDLSNVRPRVNVLNQWTYHARLYAAAKYASENADVELVQLVSFGCGIDAITTDEVRSILESRGKLYTQIKIDEITNLGAVNIRLRSLLGALDFTVNE